MKTSSAKKRISRISAMHYSKLIFRSCLFLIAAGIYIYDRLADIPRPLIRLDTMPAIIIFIWIVFITEIIFRFFPSSLESMGCQKQFKKNYIPTDNPFYHVKNPGESRYSLLIVLFSWLLLNGFIYLLYFYGIIDDGIMILISLAYSVCDMICILFFCPFQQWMMKNKCCGSCRIYNWDYAMMFTPLLPLRNFFSWSLLLLSLLLVLNWEIDFRIHPERFYENTNQALSCKNCNEKLCSHKTALRTFLIKQAELIRNTVDKQQ